MTPLHVGILLAFAACAYWAVGVLVAVVADLIRQGRAGRRQGRSCALSSARRSDSPAAAQDQWERL